jgi:hypothetical protein
MVVEIIPSADLSRLRLQSLVGRRGVVVAKGGKGGYWVNFGSLYHNEQEWFIPTKSLQIIM